MSKIIRKLKYACAAVIAVACLSGCLSVVRVAKLECANGRHKWDPVKQEYVWHRYDTGMNDPLKQFGLFPTMKTRWQMLRLTWNWAPPPYRVQRRTALPLDLLGLTPGIVLDLPVDLISVPWDWKYRTNSVDLVQQELPEKVLRSSCVACGAVSDGEFSLVRRADDKVNYDTRYGICHNCATNVAALGYSFAD